MDGPWTDITGAMSSARNPTAADIGSYLRATVTYTDEFGEQTVSGVTANAVEGRTLANTRPAFDDEIDAISVDENVKGAIGDPIVATDPDNDVLLYSIVADVDEDDNGTIDGTENRTDDEKFTIGMTTGQLSLTDKQDFESAGIRATAADTANADENDDTIAYTVTIRATDPSGAPGTTDVTVNLMDVNESPEFQDSSKDQKTLYIDENEAAPALYTHKTRRSGDAGFLALTDEAADYQATDDDTTRNAGTPLDTVGEIRYTHEGADDDEDSFAIDENSGALTSIATHNFEKQSSYSLVIVATSGGTAAARGDRERIGKLSVTVMVVDGEDGGSVSFSSREPQVGRAVIAKLSDPDGGETAVTWQWYLGGPRAEDNPATMDTDERDTVLAALQLLEDDPEAVTNNVCGDAGKILVLLCRLPKLV